MRGLTRVPGGVRWLHGCRAETGGQSGTQHGAEGPLGTLETAASPRETIQAACGTAEDMVRKPAKNAALLAQQCRAAAASTEGDKRDRGGIRARSGCAVSSWAPIWHSCAAAVARPVQQSPSLKTQVCIAGCSRPILRGSGHSMSAASGPVAQVVAKELFLDCVSVAVVGDLCSQLVRRWTRMRQTCVLIPASSYCAVCFR